MALRLAKLFESDWSVHDSDQIPRRSLDKRRLLRLSRDYLANCWTRMSNESSPLRLGNGILLILSMTAEYALSYA